MLFICIWSISVSSPLNIGQSISCIVEVFVLHAQELLFKLSRLRLIQVLYSDVLMVGPHGWYLTTHYSLLLLLLRSLRICPRAHHGSFGVEGVLALLEWCSYGISELSPIFSLREQVGVRKCLTHIFIKRFCFFLRCFVQDLRDLEASAILDYAILNYKLILWPYFQTWLQLLACMDDCHWLHLSKVCIARRI